MGLMCKSQQRKVPLPFPTYNSKRHPPLKKMSTGIESNTVRVTQRQGIIQHPDDIQVRHSTDSQPAAGGTSTSWYHSSCNEQQGESSCPFAHFKEIASIQYPATQSAFEVRLHWQLAKESKTIQTPWSSSPMENQYICYRWLHNC